jgi:hypothetical protein
MEGADKALRQTDGLNRVRRGTRSAQPGECTWAQDGRVCVEELMATPDSKSSLATLG